jgi:16S rRNA (guanine966-N2)-methyltransferase
MRIISGKMKGKTIPFINGKYGNADITTQMVKEAFFDIISSNVRDSVFLDLFSCSGQIGYEAYSRGAQKVYMNEKDRRRYLFIADFVKTNGMVDIVTVSNFDAFALLKKLHSAEISCDVIYCDPPYVKEGGLPEVYDRLLVSPDLAEILNPEGILVIQHFSKNDLPDKRGDFERFDVRIYGSNALTFYRK